MISVVTIGKSPPPWVVDAYQVYRNRLQPVWPSRLIEIAADRHPKASLRVLKEGEKIAVHLPVNAVCVALDISGKPLDSLGFAKLMTLLREQSQHQAFVIGGSDGLSDGILGRSKHVISLSQLTFTHYMARVVLIEQIYRSWCIMSRHPYHK